jgi:hypothetical protein
VPPRQREDDCGVLFETGVDDVAVPIPLVLSECRRLDLFAVLDRIVDQEEMGALTGGAGADADRVILAALLQLPFVGGADVGPDLDPGEEPFELLALDDVADVAAEARREVAVVRSRDDVLLGFLAM